ncbi:MAG: hypothetical protein GY793_02655 [Proteobacteria bacterium]|nr:hypothetical protein [Pseudomonadota bacterium]
MFKTKKAAMFGLDARVALAIFGALSIITGATLYNALQHIKTVKYNHFFNEIVKASEAYYLDNGKPLPQESATMLFSPDLLVNREALSTWKGPYVDFLKEGSTDTNFSVLKSNFGVEPSGLIHLATISDWPTGAEQCNIGDADCAEWIHVQGWGQDEVNLVDDIFIKLDKYIDNNDGPLNGKIRKKEMVPTMVHYFYFQGIPRRRTF